MRKQYACGVAVVALASLAFGVAPSMASSHREAPGITKLPKVDNTDVYVFRSYEPGRAGYVTFLANYQGLQDPSGGPNYFTLDPDAIYEIEVDNVGDGHEHLTYQFKVTNALAGGTGIQLPVGGKTLSIPLRAVPQVSGANTNVGETESYTLTLVTGDRRAGTRASVTNAATGATSFTKPLDNIGNKTIPNYAAYANQFIYTVNIPGCATTGRVFVGQRSDAFAVNLGGAFDSVNFVPIEGDSAPGAGDGKGYPGGITQSRANDEIVGKLNVDTFALEVPISCLTGTGNGVIGAWASASLPQARLLNPAPTYTSTALQGGAYVQVSRLGMPLVNELVIGLPDKDAFNASVPSGDATFLNYVTNPTFPAILDLLFRAAVGSPTTIAPTNFPRNDLVATYLTGIKSLNQLGTVTPSEMIRLNTAVNPTAYGSQSTFGVVGNDLAGFPNGRRPGDDTVDITLRVAMGRLCYPVPISGAQTALGLCQTTDAPTGMIAFTDGAPIHDTDVQNAFPYLNAPIAGSPGHGDRVPLTPQEVSSRN
jgi:hypothetical protein